MSRQYRASIFIKDFTEGILSICNDLPNDQLQQSKHLIENFVNDKIDEFPQQQRQWAIELIRTGLKLEKTLPISTLRPLFRKSNFHNRTLEQLRSKMDMK